MRWALRIVAVLVVAVVVAAAVALFTVDVNSFKDEIAAAVESRTGRALTIDGDVDLSLGLEATLTLDGLRLANADWGSRPDMLRAEQFTITVAVLPLIGGEFDIRRLVLSGVDVLLERDRDGRANWQLGGDGDSSGGGATSLQVRDIVFENATIAYRDAVADRAVDLSIPTARVTAAAADAPTNVAISGRWNELDFDVTAQLAPPDTLLTGAGPLPLAINAKLLGLEVAIDGQVAEPAGLSGLDIKIDVAGDSLTEVRQRFGEAVPAVGPLHLAARISGDANTLRIGEIALQAGASDVAGQIDIKRGGAHLRLDGTFTSQHLDLTELRRADARPDPVPGSDERVFSAAPLALDALRLADVSAVLSVAELVTAAATLRDVAASLALADGVLLVSPLQGTLAGGTIRGELALDAADVEPSLSLALQGSDLDLRGILRTSAADLLRGSAGLDIALDGRGDSVAAIMASLDGHARLVMGQGQLRATSLDMVVGGLSEVVGGLFTADTEWTPLNCLVTDFAIADGVATSQALLIDTEKIVVSGEGTVNLATEALDFKITPRPKSVTLTIAAPVTIGGTLAAPSFGVDELGVARRVGGLAGAFFFPPALILGLGNLGGDDNACLQMLAGDGAAGAPETTPESDEPTLGDAKQGVKDALEGVGNAIKGIFER